MNGWMKILNHYKKIIKYASIKVSVIVDLNENKHLRNIILMFNFKFITYFFFEKIL